MQLRYTEGGQIAAEILPGEALAGFAGPLELVVADLQADVAVALAVKALIAGGMPVAPAPTPPPPPIPETVSRFQGRMALRAGGLFDTVDAKIAASSDVMLKEAWDSASEFHRHSPFIEAMAAELGLTDAQTDALFTQAALIVA